MSSWSGWDVLLRRDPLQFAAGDCLIFFIPPQQTFGLFSVPAPSLHLACSAGFFIALAR